MRTKPSPHIKAAKFAQELRNNPTDTERFLWQYLRNKQIENVKFRRQHAIDNHIVDFVSLEIKLVIELDGGQHVQQNGYDQQRDDFLHSQGFNILSFWNNDVLTQTSSVLEQIYERVCALKQPIPTLTLPLKERELAKIWLLTLQGGGWEGDGLQTHRPYYTNAIKTLKPIHLETTP